MSSTPMTEATFYILLSLIHPSHGYGMMQSIKELSKGRLIMGPGTLYGVLTRMNKEDLIGLVEEEGRKKTYHITALGIEALKEEYQRLKNQVDDGKILEDLT
ncbi:PadR family transcriptional regulator [Proteiniclasticum ruminis]|uniref:PadR family transcriptional regulator n=1 Tax=Proteiniclasticum ruminis TaxID=398199 RepID=UPI0028B11D30|nr:PadR family transcriptional regulator [Proteiniclasticum ruminis]